LLEARVETQCTVLGFGERCLRVEGGDLGLWPTQVRLPLPNDDVYGTHCLHRVAALNVPDRLILLDIGDEPVKLLRREVSLDEQQWVGRSL
jgi:hypothetical protein